MTLGTWMALALTLSFAQTPAPPSTEDAAREAFKKGVGLFQKKDFNGAAEALTQVPELGGYLSLYKHWYLGQSLLELNKIKEAEPEFAKVMQSQASAEMKYSAQFFWAEAALRQKRYSEAIAKLIPLEKKWRRSYRYPEVLYRLVLAEWRQGHVASACRRAVLLYSKYPAHSLVINWGSDLKQVEIDGKKLGCKHDMKNFADRVRSLQWTGESDKANREIVDLLAKAPEASEQRRDLDLLLANFMVNEGNVEDALNLLIRYYPQLKSNMEYLTLLGKAAARSGEYQTAVGAYERAFELSPKSKKGREALYQAAYLSYQFQDYDGAVRKFQQFTKANPKSGLAKDAEWHLAWLQYLRNDFKGALEKFEAALKNAKLRRKNDTLKERLLYWTAMSRIRLNQHEGAQKDLEAIIAKNPYSYYGLAAQARLGGVVAKINENAKRLPASDSDKDGKDKDEAKKAAPAPTTALDTATVASSGDEEKESEEEIVDDSAADIAIGGEGPEDGPLTVSTFKDPAQRARIDVALKLIALGLPELAKWELWEVERHTRNPQYLRMLIAAYEGIHSFNRSATIAELSFGREREVGGFEGARTVWQQAYPQAYKKWVDAASKEFSVPQEWIWAIMRTESMYKPDVISPVGARGLMQLMQYTARNLTKLRGEPNEQFDLLNPETNIRMGAQYLARLQTKFKGALPLAAAAYNAGPHRVENWLVNFGHLETDEFVEHIPFLETRNYVKKVVRSHTFYRRLYAKDQKPVEFLAKALGVPIPSRASTRESWDSL